MVPRVVTYYGQPLRSICPFCGATFAKFPGGFQQFFQRFSKKIVSFDAFKRIALVAAGFGLIWLLAKMEIIPREMEALGIFGSIIFSAFGLAELFLSNDRIHCETVFTQQSLLLVGYSFDRNSDSVC